MNNWKERTALLLGSSNVEKLARMHVLVVGLGGVGAMAAEQLVRAGVGNLTLVDADEIALSNINRQIHAFQGTVGKNKTEILAHRLAGINPHIHLNILTEYLRDERMVEVLQTRFDFVVDAIDTLAPKVYLIYHSLQKGYPIVSSMGSGGKLDPTQVTVSDISQTQYCKLARMVRKRLHKLAVYKGVRAVYSPEMVFKHSIIDEQGTNKASNVGTISYMPAIFGCFCAAEVIRHMVQ